MRGKLTEAIKVKSKELLGYEITQIELRLMPYVQYVMMNARCIDLARVNEDDEIILTKWHREGRIDDPGGTLKISKQFWDALSELCYMAYVVYDQ